MQDNSTNRVTRHRDYHFFEVYYSLKKNRLDEAKVKLRKMQVNHLSRPARLRYYAFLGELRFKQQGLNAAEAALSKALQLAESCSRANRKVTGKAQLLLGSIYYRKGQYLKAFQVHRAMLTRVEHNSLEQLQLHNSLGGELLVLGRYQDALTYYREAVLFPQAINYPDECARACLGAAICYKQLDNFDHSLIFVRRGLELAANSSQEALLAKLHHIMAVMLLLSGDCIQAELHQHQAIRHAQRADVPEWLALTIAGLAQVQAVRANLTTACQTMAVAEALDSKHNNPFLAYTLADYAYILSLQGYYDEAEATFQRGLQYLKYHPNEDSNGVLANHYYRHADALARRGDHRQAVQFYNRALENQELAQATVV